MTFSSPKEAIGTGHESSAIPDSTMRQAKSRASLLVGNRSPRIVKGRSSSAHVTRGLLRSYLRYGVLPAVVSVLTLTGSHDSSTEVIRLTTASIGKLSSG